MRRKLALAMLAACLWFAVSQFAASAHGTTQVGDYEIEIGFHNEPAVVGLPNSLDLFVTNTTNEEKVNGLEETLQAEIIFGSSKQTLQIEPMDEEEGAYTAFLIPTQLGDYTWHITGEIEGTPVDISMTSGPDTFGSVEAASVYEFPAATKSGGGAATSTALVAGILGIILGAAGAILGFMGWQAARKR